MGFLVNVDNEVTLAWLDSALGWAFMEGKPELWAYLEVVLEEVLFDEELKVPA